jgi:hypothetical protein
VKNDGSLQFLRKWGITSSSFMRDVLHRGEPFGVAADTAEQLRKDIHRSKWKRALTIFKSTKAKDIWTE